MVCFLICEIIINYIRLGVLANVFGGRTSVGWFLNDFVLVKHHNNCGSGRITNLIVLSCTHSSHSETLYTKYKPVDLLHTGIVMRPLFERSVLN